MNKYNDLNNGWDHFEDIENYKSPIQYIMINSHMIPLYVLIETNINSEECKNSKIKNQQIYFRPHLYNYIINKIVTFIATIIYF